jgi:ABC-type glutathione transport system ATPase component
MVRCFRAPEIQKDLERLVGTETEELGLENLNEKIIEVRNLSKSFSIRKSRSAVKAVDDVSFFVRKGETLGVVGESGSGKSTVAKILLGIERLDSGDVLVCGESRNSKAKNWKQRKMWGGQLQVVFQDPFTSLDPRQTPHQAIDEVLQLHFPTRNRQKSIDELLKSVGIFEDLQHSLPSELSGGQLQRVAIAKALAAQPEAIILDEAVSGLDVSIQAQILNLLSELQQKTGVTFLFISHDLAVVRQLCHRVIVMNKGKVVEEGLTVDVLSSPKDDYTRRLIDSAPRPNWVLPGSLSA